ncbi:DUF2442 domain-containing protein [Dechloromonas sp.]|uniref:DUF2442 domain-containing protein n=1 Tax=Dechloromonas sp. TaxID=1917218 RepID=UPI001215E51C|nr:DUF2442 domain-containing protein [Dechloromonas sp.]MBU3696800.1 DUF2442 domain-containing protein [Dechloromonas sp.]TEX44330.1 MAG: hypothetical protein CFR70_14115 [Rhodocyclaceae bacterium]
MTPDVTHVCSLPDYDLLVSFEDGEWRRFSVKPYLQFPAYQPLMEPTRFMAAHVLNGTVAWPGDIDISPDTIYITGVRVIPSNS